MADDASLDTDGAEITFMTTAPNKVDCTDEVICECTEVPTLEVHTALVPLGEGADESCT